MKRSWLFVALALGCAQATEIDASKESAKESGGKGDHGVDLCDFYGWYGDGECDDWCPESDLADCASVCCDVVDYPEFAPEGAHCCADGTWAYDNGNGAYDNECDYNGGAGQSCETPEPTCCDMADYPEFAPEGAHCCADGSWVYDNGNGTYDNECDYNGGAGQSCETPEPTCCDMANYPEFAPEGAHCCADGTWAYDNGNGTYDNECDYNGGEGEVCGSACPDLDFSIACINPATYECRAGTLPYDGSAEGCECGCIKSEACLDPDAAGIEYLGNAEQCTRIRFACDADEDPFWNECGCGCVAQ